MNWKRNSNGLCKHEPRKYQDMTERSSPHMKQPLIVLTGPTAVGKTSLSIQLAKAIGGEIISADSMQVYRHMDIGSAKVTADEMEGSPITSLMCWNRTRISMWSHSSTWQRRRCRESITAAVSLSLQEAPVSIYRRFSMTLISRKMRTGVLCGGNWRNWLPGRGSRACRPARHAGRN